MADHADDDGDDINGVFVYMGGLIPQHLRETITHVRVHKSVKIITREAFQYCGRLVWIEMHDGVDAIEEYAFYKCTSLREIKFAGVKVIGAMAFNSCTSLAEVEFGDKLETVGVSAFNRCTSLRNIKLPKVRVIKFAAFANCKQLTDVEFSEDLETMEGSVLAYCRRLRRIAMPLKDDMFDEIGDDFRAFKNCDNLSHVDLVGGVHKTVSSLLLDSWRNEITHEIVHINQDLPTTPTTEKTAAIQQWMETVTRRIEHFKSEHSALLKEFTTLLELALWKAKLDESQDERPLGNDQPAKKAKVDVKAARQEQRITSGANIVIKNVLPFLKLE
jgi:hypothetical protein